MWLDPFFYFDGDCRQAIDFYVDVFQIAKPDRLMTYGQLPADGSAPDADCATDEGLDNARPAAAPATAPEGSGRILYSSLPIFEHNIMLADVPAGSPYQRGGNVAITLGHPDAAEVERLFNRLADGGEIDMPLGKTFFSSCYGMLTDKFGIRWQLSATEFED
jgi:PhnB protein